MALPSTHCTADPKTNNLSRLLDQAPTAPSTQDPQPTLTQLSSALAPGPNTGEEIIIQVGIHFLYGYP